MPKIRLTDKDIEQIAKKVMNEVVDASDFLTIERERAMAYRVFDALSNFQNALRTTELSEEHAKAVKQILENEIWYVGRYIPSNN